jgi:deoxyribonuclease V
MVRTVNRLPEKISLIAGTDVSGADERGEVRAVVVLLSYPTLKIVEVAHARERPPFPYIPGLLSFRETPVLLKAFECLQRTPDLIIVDGQGTAHPRRFGIACHLGLLLDAPAIGCGKSILTGRYGTLAWAKGATAPLVDKGETIGAAVRTRNGVSPVYISPGHHIDMPTSIAWVIRCATRYRLPEPTRLAHQTATALLNEPRSRLL